MASKIASFIIGVALFTFLLTFAVSPASAQFIVSPTATPTPTISVLPLTGGSGTPTATVTPPVAGDSLPTIALFGSVLVLLVLGALTWRTKSAQA